MKGRSEKAREREFFRTTCIIIIQLNVRLTVLLRISDILRQKIHWIHRYRIYTLTFDPLIEKIMSNSHVIHHFLDLNRMTRG